jgi:hypothetical protein
MNGIERRIERLEKELGSTGERLLVIIQRLSEDGELTQMRCGATFIDRMPDESEAGFTTRAEGEAMRLSDPLNSCVVLIETKRGALIE